ncbi:MAG TPA: deoxyribodipyrimidine photo-lyase [Puia sp.]|nr:deoxyribodipyrimidine photo-lyase [Puia sp.]
MATAVAIFWFRRDLRLEDNAGLHHALTCGLPVLPLFIFDRNILDRLENRADRRVEFIQAALVWLQEGLAGRGTSLEVRDGRPLEVFNEILGEWDVKAVYTNTDYEPEAVDRDEGVKKLLALKRVPFYSFKDQVIFEKNEVVKANGEPYTVFTPYSKRWKSLLTAHGLHGYASARHEGGFLPRREVEVPALAELGFERTGGPFPSNALLPEILRQYKDRRDWPAVVGTSRLGVHLRFGTVSIRHLVRRALRESETYLTELIWREFFQMILWYFPAMGRGRAFKPSYEKIGWRNNEREFQCWCEGRTGYPIVDAGIRELNATGFMHNRVRMIAASFLAKHLLIDWRWGEAYFAEKLLDFDLASNNGNWQWAAGCGCDAAPYFRIFNPIVQASRWDPESRYIQAWVPEWGTPAYSAPIVEHATARERALAAYKKALSGRGE